MSSLAARSRIAALTAIMMLVSSLAVPASAHGSSGQATKATVVPIVDGLIGPLGLAVAPRGTAFVVEAFAGRLTRVDRDGRTTTPFTAAPGDSLPGGVAVVGAGRTLFTMAVGGGGEAPPDDTTLELLRRGGRSRTIASLAAHEEDRNPDGRSTYGFRDVDDACLATLPDEFPPQQPYQGIIESNPYAVAVLRGRAIVADAAGNTVLAVTPRGRVSTIAVLPPTPQTITADIAAERGLDDCVVGATYHSESVPTDVEVGPHGHLYVSSLPGVPEALGNGSVWRIDPRTGSVERVATGFLGAVDLAVARDGTIYVADLFAGTISSVRRGRTRVVAEVPSPGAVEIGPRGTLYATTGVFAEGDETGQLVQISGRRR